MNEIKALVLFSGGLDSILAAKMLARQEISVTALAFFSYFFDSQRAKDSAEKLGLPIIQDDLSERHLEVVKKPRYGHGSGMNPCIDCHGLMLKRAAEIAQAQNFDIIATGEVLGQRPFSQSKRALAMVESYAGLQQRVLRPLSAKCLPMTMYEEQALVDRAQLCDIHGRSRQVQMTLAQQWGIEDYPTPGGGCRLTEREFSDKLRSLLEKTATQQPADFALLRFGRHFWLPANDLAADKSRSYFTHVILGRNREENISLERNAQPQDIVIKRLDEKGPTAIIRALDVNSDHVISESKKLIQQYSKTNINIDDKQQWNIRSLPAK